MELKILKNTSKNLELEISDENETLLNPIIQVLLTYDDVEFASIITEHPNLPSRVLYVRMNKNTKEVPLKALQKAVKQIEKEVADFKKQFNSSKKSKK
jgi:DNA-directed RNA polymerase subunit L